MKQVKFVLIACLGVVLLTVSTKAPSAPQNQGPSYTRAEYDAYQTALIGHNPEQKIKLLDDFAARYPTSTLLPYVYRAESQTYYQMKNYPQTVEYVDKLLAFGDRIPPVTRLEILISRAQAYCFGSADGQLQTPEAHRRASDAATQGLKTLDQWQKPTLMSDEDFAVQVKNIRSLFGSVAAGEPCPSPPPNDTKGTKTFDQMIDQIKSEEHQSPAVR